MFNWIMDVGNQEERQVDRYEKGDLFIDTAAVSDGRHPYETAVEHPKYNLGKMIIVEAYDTKEEAQEGHNKWVKTMTEDPLPSVLVDCANSGLQNLLVELGEESSYPRID